MVCSAADLEMRPMNRALRVVSQVQSVRRPLFVTTMAWSLKN